MAAASPTTKRNVGEAASVPFDAVVSRCDTGYGFPMIVSFRHKGLEAFYRSETTKGIQSAHAASLAEYLPCLKSPWALPISIFLVSNFIL
jgi:hypothetical protein